MIMSTKYTSKCRVVHEHVRTSRSDVRCTVGVGCTSSTSSMYNMQLHYLYVLTTVPTVPVLDARSRVAKGGRGELAGCC